MNTYYKAGTWNVICAVCGGKYKSDEVLKRWDGLIVCKADYETRHTLDFIRAPQETPPVPFTAPQLPVVFVPLACPYPTIAGQANIGTAGCARAGETINYIPTGQIINAIAESAIADLCVAHPEPLL